MDGVIWWRDARPFLALDKMYGDKLEIHHVSESVDLRILMPADVVVMFRPTTEKAFNFLKICRRFGAKIILDIDDDLWHIPATHPDFGHFSEYRERLHEIYGFADTVWTSTEHLLYAADCLDRGEVMQNAVLPEELPDRSLPWKSVAAWRGHSKHISDLMSAETQEWYRRSAPIYEHFVFAGYFPPLPHGANARFVKGVDAITYFVTLRQGFANVIWKPLEECKFNDGKSNIAAIEATMGGGVCVTNYAGKPGWEFALPEFTNDPDEIAAAWEKARDCILGDYNLLEVTERRFKSIVNLVK